MLKHVLRAVDCLLLSRLWRQSQFISTLSETQGGGLIRDQFPPNTTPARRESQRRYGGNSYRAVDLLVNYIGLMFNLYF